MMADEDRCERTDLLRADCAHCRPKPEGLDIRGRFIAEYHGTCLGCMGTIQPGDNSVFMSNGEVRHERCA